MKMKISIEEKARRYDEAYKKVAVRFGSNVADEIFPELKESEDERTREWLIRLIKATCDYDSPTSRKEVDDALAWLEKQGEQKSVECCADKLWTEFQKQVAYLMASSYNREYEYTKGYVEWVAQSLLGYAKNEIEQKPAEWSDDDEAFLDDILCKVESNLLLNKDEKNWLKSIKDRVQPQNKWKESLATADLENSLCHIQSGFPDTSYEYRILGEAIEFIRCTEPKSQWTPSEGQMKLLREVQQALLGKDCHNRFVNFMYELKRLREE